MFERKLHKRERRDENMGHCSLDHSLVDVRQKFESQVDFLPDEIKVLFHEFFLKEHSQDILNETFHLLKIYDLVDEGERSARDKQLLLIIQNV